MIGLCLGFHLCIYVGIQNGTTLNPTIVLHMELENLLSFCKYYYYYNSLVFMSIKNNYYENILVYIKALSRIGGCPVYNSIGRYR